MLDSIPFIKVLTTKKGAKRRMIYNKIKELAREKGVTIQQMEKDLSLSERNTCKWNDVLPRADTLKKVADYFGVTIEYLIQ